MYRSDAEFQRMMFTLVVLLFVFGIFLIGFLER